MNISYLVIFFFCVVLSPISLAKDEAPPSSNLLKNKSWQSAKPINMAAQDDAAGINLSTNTILKTGPQGDFDAVDRYQVNNKTNPLAIALKADDMLGGVASDLTNLDTNHSILVDRMPQYLMQQADQMTEGGKDVYDRIHDIYTDVGQMKNQVNQNYEAYNQSPKTQEDANRLNTAADQMAAHTSELRTAVEAMRQQADLGRNSIDGMFNVLDGMQDNGKEALGYYDDFANHIKDVSRRFEDMARLLQAQGLGADAVTGEVRRYLTALQEYIKGHKPFTTQEIQYVKDVKAYLQRTKDYLNKTAKDLDQTHQFLAEHEAYFKNAKVKANGAPKLDLNPQEAPDVCAAAPNIENGKKGKPLSSLDKCQKDCRTVCRWKSKFEGQNCYECPSGSPDTCFDVGGWPEKHPWCQPGGVCYDDPNLYCEPFGAIGPNLEKLQCTRCKQRQDECWQKVGQDTTNLTHCRQGCFNGTCVYKGKYENKEWDGKPEFMHCYKCETPPGPPSCEDLGWGTTWISDCQKNCPDPGQCVKEKQTVGPGGRPVPGIDPGKKDGPNPGGDLLPGDEKKPEGGGTVEHGKNNPEGAEGGTQPNPPDGTPQQPGGGGAIAGGDNAPTGQGAEEKKEEPKNETPPKAPGTTSEPKEPTAPNTGDKPKPPDNPDIQLPENPDIVFYKKWLKETQERIKSREDIINDANEGEETKKEAQRQLESMTREKEDLEKKIGDKEDEEERKRKELEDQKKRAEEYERTRPKPVDYAKEAERRGQEWKLNKLKLAADALKTKLEEARDSIEARKARIQRISQRIDELRNKTTRSKEEEQELQDLIKNRTELTNKLKEKVNQYNQEIEQLKSEYQTALWRLDENARRKAEAQRIDEYMDEYTELKRREQLRAIKNDTMDGVAKNLEGARDAARAAGNSDAADDYQRQLDNLKRAQSEMNQSLERQEQNIKDHLYELGKRNFDQGAGPINIDGSGGLGDALNDYAKYFKGKLDDAQKAIDQLEGMSSRSKEQNDQLNALKASRDNLQSALDGIKEKQDLYKNPQVSEEDKQRVVNSTLRITNASLDRDADKSFLRLAGESLVEEAVHNLNPLVAAKKTLAFGVGVAQGVGAAVKGVAEIGVGAAATLAQATAVDLGFEDGGIFGTSALDAINGVATTVSNNLNFDGMLKAVVAAGGAIDAKITELEHSKDIDWATAKFGGQVAGEYVIGQEVVAAGMGKALGKAGELLKGGKAAEDVVEVARTGSKIDDALEAGRAGSKIDEAAQTGSRAIDEVGNVKPVETPTAPRAPPPEPTTAKLPAFEEPPATSVGPNSKLAFTDEGGKVVNLETAEQLGKGGSSSKAYVNADDPTKVVRVTDTSKIANADVLDNVGRQAVEGIQKPDGPISIVRRYERYVVNDPASPLNGKVVEINDRVTQGMAKDIIEAQGGVMTDGQAKAFDLANRELNKNGFAWMDNHTGNYTFQKIEGTTDGWRVQVVDSGGIVKMKGATLAEQAENAAALQARLNAPEEGTKEFLEMMRQRGGDENYWVNVGRERGVIMDQFADVIDAKAMGIKSPYDVAFFPFGTLDYPNVQALARASAEAAAH